MIEIKKKHTLYNYEKMNSKVNRYIVVHYVGGESSAKNNADYFYNNKLSSSAHYFVDENDIWQVVEDFYKAWHCGGGAQGGYHPYLNICTNSNSIGVEMCCFKDNNGNWKFKDGTIKNTISLIKYLMEKYKIPEENVIRHYDVTGKLCPQGYISKKEWENFKDMLTKPQIELTSANDIVWELMHRGIVSDGRGMLDEMNKNPDGRLYWLARKALCYIKARD